MSSTPTPKTIRVDLRDMWMSSGRGRPASLRQLLPEVCEGDHIIAFVSEPVACSEVEVLNLRRVARAARKVGARLTMYPPTGRPVAVVTP